MVTNCLKEILALWRAPGFGAQHFWRLLNLFPDIREVFQCNAKQLKQLGCKENFIHYLQHINWRLIESDLCWSESVGQFIITWQDQSYPTFLKEIPGAPPILFVRGQLHCLQQPQIAMVGSRKSTPAGERFANYFARELVQAGFTITSGLALGIDAACHRATLKANGKTIAVLGTGVDRIYPRRHHALAEEIMQTGAIVSELPLGTQPCAQNFPPRNRIISGLSLGTLVVEAALKSGSLITARYAAEQGREVFTLPGTIDNAMSRGCNALIKQGVKLVETIQDIIDELPQFAAFFMPAANENDLSVQLPDLSSEQLRLIKHLSHAPQSLDSLITQIGLTASSISSMLLALELQGLVRVTPGGYVVNF